MTIGLRIADCRLRERHFAARITQSAIRIAQSLLYSYRSASIGDSREALRAG